MHILLVDDEVEFLELMGNRLERRGFTVTTCNSGKEALELVHKSNFDAVVLDVKMPGEDGIAVLKKLKQAREDIEVLLLSGHTSVESAMMGIEMGAMDYLLKPVALNDLISRLQQIAVIKS